MTHKISAFLFLPVVALLAACVTPEATPNDGGAGAGGSPAGGSGGTGGATVVCGDAAQCPPPADPICYEATCDGTCHVSPKVVNTPCGNNQACNGAGACVATCGGSLCGDDDPCTIDNCIDGVCLYAPAPVGTDCGNGKVCMPDGKCGYLGQCSVPTDCDDDNPCTVDICGADTAGGVFYCHHSPASGHNKCGNGGWCNDSEGTCCAGCNLPVASGFTCVAVCPIGSVCFDGFCV